MTLAEQLAALSVGLIAGSPTPEHAAAHVQIARERGVDETRIAAALALSALVQAADVHTIESRLP